MVLLASIVPDLFGVNLVAEEI